MSTLLVAGQDFVFSYDFTATNELNETTTEELNEEQLRTLRNTREQDVNRIKKEIE